MTGPLQVHDDGPVRVLTFDVPERRNAITVPLRRELRAALEAAHADETCRALVVTGAGKHFSSGGDISSMPQGDRADARDRLHLVADVISLLVEGPLPVVAAVEGAAVGAGTSVVAACDYVVAARGSRYGAIFGRIGLVADSGLFWTLPRKVGAGPARRLLLRGNIIDADEAHRLGLVDELVDDGSALAVAIDRAKEMAEAAPLALAATKRILADPPATLAQTLHAEETAQVAMFETEDFTEGRAAFLEKRSPVFRGR
ncbi:enoyl-CoA hydratase/isomerase family protein [Actinomycetospora termitidis]|uniref:Enoyl-CoA hydratase/isomerase family protein n=1 Tax=Actinomycetospora termitidis TaxID=3053470 RepID=A0ABT7MD81_9PSEU|nr:enoyl-CoA hydratase/isomerase family protein [Actinomycetospora sp. Odt1-22]MDL5158129.1 enoyl-CoA hydratase/isomerase family protein [Actinomycetospora sp. Odt1-22]